MSINGGMDKKMLHIEWNVTQSLKYEIMPFVATGIQVKIIILHEAN